MKRLSIIGLVVMWAGILSAQPRLKQAEISLGVHAGVMASTIDFYPKMPYMTPLTKACLLVPNGGIVFRYSKHKYCGFQVELNYMQRGWAENGSDSTANISYRRRLHYLELPFLMHVYVGRKTVRGFIVLGPQIGYCIKDEGGSGEKQTGEVHQYEPITHPFDWGVAGGLGMMIYTKNAGIYQLEARFNYSLGTIFASTATDYFKKSHPMNLSINIGWLWEFKPKPLKKVQAL